MVINNKLKSVIVLKAVGMPNLRLFPGHNRVNEQEIDKYFNNAASKAHQKDNLTVVEEAGMSAEERKQADNTEEKNTKLNKGYKSPKIPGKKVK